MPLFQLFAYAYITSSSGIGDSVMEGGHLEMRRDPAIMVKLSVVATLVKIVRQVTAGEVCNITG